MGDQSPAGLCIGIKSHFIQSPPDGLWCVVRNIRCFICFDSQQLALDGFEVFSRNIWDTGEHLGFTGMKKVCGGAFSIRA